MLVVNYNSHEAVDRLLATLPADQRVAVSIVDNSENAEELRSLAAAAHRHVMRFGHVSVVPAPGNLGYGSGNNFAYQQVEHLDFATVVVANPDVELQGPATRDLVDSVIQLRGVVGVETIEDGKTVVATRLRPATGRAKHVVGTPDRVRGGFIYPGGHFLIIDRSAWQRLGGFDERYFLYCEELDLVLRARRLMISVGFTDDIRVAHGGSGAAGARSGLSAKTSVGLHHATRSRVLLYRAHAELRWFLPCLLATRICAAAVLAARAKGRPAWAILSGLASGSASGVRP
ncbi:glycosyltransferase [Nocardioides sp. J9]|uniref:glycosyltransferase n=1 Tax=Nocardioides sp. J9 TaxID=935844 RepID=UPI0016480F8D|nr:glycosyltransferase [Nocardioides sp. J9]